MRRKRRPLNALGGSGMCLAACSTSPFVAAVALKCATLSLPLAAHFIFIFNTFLSDLTWHRKKKEWKVGRGRGKTRKHS